MNVEPTDRLVARAALHAAMSDAGRLAVVDLLNSGDASPSELQVLLEMPSNLLAHHLKVLERAGLVTRSRSEGDHRRTYVRLVPGVLEGLLPPGLTAAPRVVFVCTQNSARSQLAVALWRRSSHVPVTSAGTHPAMQLHPGAVAAARRRGLPLRGSRPRATQDVLQAEDFVVTVCDAAHEQLGAAARLHWSIPDPVRDGSDEAFDRALDELGHRVGELASRLDTPAQSRSPR
jgi:ArsR family transcriptional regulator, arsenate/arsenite/antimonite-responsive transcriptional repressor / arsenate reductase (thioredoxin)